MAESLADKRKRLKLSRADVAKVSGLTQAQIVRIENGGPRTKDEEVAKLNEALDSFAGEAPDPS